MLPDPQASHWAVHLDHHTERYGMQLRLTTPEVCVFMRCQLGQVPIVAQLLAVQAWEAAQGAAVEVG
jgi:hypothetical protein